ncbi:MAG: hypothetical protein IKU19_03725, partial [Clostridia bacterium]|nr:hypothetical protein [Clostridia bacterium]
GNVAAKRLVEQIGSTGDCTYRQLTGYTMNGKIHLRPVGNSVKEFIISGNREIASLFLSDVTDHIISKGISAEIDLSCVDMNRIEGIFFPESSVWIHIDRGDSGDSDKVINAKRFVNKEIETVFRQRLRFGRKCMESLEDGALTALAEARECHFFLEDIYRSYMNFDALEEQSSLWYSEILSRLD